MDGTASVIARSTARSNGAEVGGRRWRRKQKEGGEGRSVALENAHTEREPGGCKLRRRTKARNNPQAEEEDRHKGAVTRQGGSRSKSDRGRAQRSAVLVVGTLALLRGSSRPRGRRLSGGQAGRAATPRREEGGGRRMWGRSLLFSLAALLALESPISRKYSSP